MLIAEKYDVSRAANMLALRNFLVTDVYRSVLKKIKRCPLTLLYRRQHSTELSYSAASILQ